MPNAVHQGARLARAARPIVSLLVVAALARAQEPAEIPDGWTLVDDLILPQWAVNGDANYSATPWPNGVVPYAFNANVTALNQTRAIDAMAEWEAVSAVTFVPRTTEANYITFNDSTGNSSFVGMIGGSQNVNMFNWSWRFIICHELAHALGFWHEQSRPDRDTYVTINWGNIDPAYSYNFFTQSSTTVGAYDFDSIMHYGQFAFSNNGLPTITVNPPNGAMQGTIGQRQHMSILDAGGVSFRYGPAPAPTITSISPTSANAGAAQLTLTVNGTKFHKGSIDGPGVAGTVVEWNGVALATTYVTPTQLTAVVPASYLATPGAQQVTVYNPSPGGGVSAASAFTVLGGPPVLTSLSPASTTAGAAGFTLTCNGSAFQAGSVVRWNGADLSTTFVSAAHLTATVTAAHVAAGGLQAVTVHTPGASGGTSAALNFSVNSAFPTLASVAPNSGTAGAASVALVATGTGFNPASKVRWNGVDLPTGFTSASQLTATVGAAQLATAGAATVTIFNPFPGGGTSFGQTFTVNNPAPAITSLTPASAPQNGGPTTITVNGSGFVTTSQVKRNSQNLATTFVSATQLTATITAPMTNSQGTSTITVVNGAPGGGTSAGATFTVTAPAPTLASLAPSSAIALSGATVVTATGTGFQTDVVLRWNGVDLPTTYVGPTQATATIPATQLTGPTTASIVARNVGDGWSSAPQTFTVHPAAPTLLFVAPWQVAAGAPTQTLSAAGSQYVPSSQILWNGAALATTYAGPGQLNAVVPASLLATGVAANVVVFTPPPGGGTSSPMVVNVLNPAPTLTSVAPASMSTSLINGSLTLNGAGFVPGSVAQWNGAPLATTYVGPTQLTAVLPAALLASGGIASATVSNPAPGGGVSAPAVVTVNNPMPVVLGLAPSQLTAGDVATTLSASGFNFNPSTVLRWNGTPLSTTLVSAFSVHATVPASFLAQPGTASVTAHNPAPGGGTSAPAVASVLAPSLTSVSPAVIAPMAYGAPPLSLTLTGARLLPGAEVWGDGVLLTSTSLGATQIQCELPSTLEQARRDGGLALVVRNGGVALSNALALTVGGGANLGVQITDPPTRDLAGQTFAFRIEAVPPGMPFTVFADLAATPFTTGFPTPAVGLVLGVGGPVTTPLVDGVGLFGPPAGVVFGAGPAGATPPGGVFVAPGLLAPAAPAADLTLQTLYVDPTSPLGWRLTWATSPRPF